MRRGYGYSRRAMDPRTIFYRNEYNRRKRASSGPQCTSDGGTESSTLSQTFASLSTSGETAEDQRLNRELTEAASDDARGKRKATEEIELLPMKLREAADDLEKATSGSTQLSKELEDLKNECQRLRQDREQWEDSCHELKAATSAELKRLTSRNKELQETVDAQRAQIDLFVGEKDSLVNDNKRLADRILLKDTEATTYRVERDSLQKKYREAEKVWKAVKDLEQVFEPKTEPAE